MEPSENLSNDNNLYRFGPFTADAKERLLRREGEILPLTPRAFDLLLVLLRSAGQLKSREELIQILWPRTIVEESNLTWNVNAVRKALGDTHSPYRYLTTVRGHGYRFVAPVAVEHPRPTAIDESDPEEAASQDGGLTAPPLALHQRWPRKFHATAGLLTIIVILGGFAAYFALRPSGRSTPDAPRSIAVLPFENLDADNSNNYFTRGIQDTILTKLAAIRALRVVSRTSTEQYSSRPKNLKAVAKQLGVSTILEGSVQRADHRVLINVQLINTRTDRHIWAASYTRTLNNVFEVENDIAHDVATALQLRLLPKESERLAKQPTDNPGAYDSFLRAEYLISQVGSPGNKTPDKTLRKAAGYYHRAIAQDPKFALAYARLSRLYSYSYWFHFDHSAKRLANAKRAAKKALSLAPDLPQAHLAMGYVYYWGLRDYAAALEEFKLVHQKLPNDVSAIGAMAYIRRRQGKWKEAIQSFRHAETLDPRNPNWPNELGTAYTQLRRYAQAMRQFDRALAVAPHSYYPLLRKVCALLLTGKPAQARTVLAGMPRDLGPQPRSSILGSKFESLWLDHHPNRALTLFAEPTASWMETPFAVGPVPTSLLLAKAWSLSGNQGQARQEYEAARVLLKKELEKRPDNPNLLSSLALVEAGLNQKAAAIRSARRASGLLPPSKDALDGPSYLVTLAQVYAQIAKPAQAVQLLHRLLEMPAGMYLSVPLLRLDPVWDPIRRNPAFQALLKEYSAQPAVPGTLMPNTGAKL